MKIAVLSDTHDHVDNLEKVLDQINGKVGAIIHCGDVIAPFTTGLLASSDIPTYVVLGNNDEDHIGMYKKGNEKFTWVHVGQQFGELEIDNRKLAYTHYPKLGELLARSGDYDAVFYGHTHKSENKMINETLLLNPGAVCGINAGYVLGIKGEKPGIASFGIYDTKTNSAEVIEIK